jgi:hypothetical protein
MPRSPKQNANLPVNNAELGFAFDVMVYGGFESFLSDFG